MQAEVVIWSIDEIEQAREGVEVGRVVHVPSTLRRVEIAVDHAPMHVPPDAIFDRTRRRRAAVVIGEVSREEPSRGLVVRRIARRRRRRCRLRRVATAPYMMIVVVDDGGR